MIVVQENAAQATAQISKVLIVSGFVLAVMTTIQTVALLAWF